MELPPMRKGNRYLVPDKDGSEVEGILLSGAVNRPEMSFYGVYKLADGRQIIATSPIIDSEFDYLSREFD